MKKTVFALLVFVFGMSLYTNDAFACSIGETPGPKIQNDFNNVDLIFIGEVQSIRKIKTVPDLPPGTIYSDDYVVEVTFKITKNYKGFFKENKFIKVRTNFGGLCSGSGITGWETVKPGAQWLIYTWMLLPEKASDELYFQTSALYPTAPMEKADEKVIQFLDDYLKNETGRMKK